MMGHWSVLVKYGAARRSGGDSGESNNGSALLQEPKNVVKLEEVDPYLPKANEEAEYSASSNLLTRSC